MSPRVIISAVAAHYGLTVAALRRAGQRGDEMTARARRIAFYLCRRHTRASFPEIGRAFGGMHHTTVLAGHAAVVQSPKLQALADDVVLPVPVPDDVAELLRNVALLVRKLNIEPGRAVRAFERALHA